MGKNTSASIFKLIKNSTITIALLMIPLFIVSISQANPSTDLNDTLSAAFSTRVGPHGRYLLMTQMPAIERSISTRAEVDGASDDTLIQIYFPLRDGKLHNYELSAYDIDFTYTYDLVEYHGKYVYREHDNADGSSVYYGFSGTTLYLYGFAIDNPDLNSSNVKMVFNEPVTVLTDDMLRNFGSVTTTISFTFEGQTVTMHTTSTAENAGTVVVPSGTFDDCIEVSVRMAFQIQATREIFEMKEVWTLAPDVGKIEIAVVDQSLTELGMAGLVDWTPGTGEMVETTSAHQSSNGGDDGGGSCFITALFSGLQP